MNEKTEPMTAEALMGLVSEYGQCRWSEGSSGATYLDRMGERRSREEAADLFAQIETAVAALAASPSSKSTKEAPTDTQRLDWLEKHFTDVHGVYVDASHTVLPFAVDCEEDTMGDASSGRIRAAIDAALASSSIKEDGERAEPAPRFHPAQDAYGEWKDKP